MVETYHELAKVHPTHSSSAAEYQLPQVHVKLDQPGVVLDNYMRSIEKVCAKAAFISELLLLQFPTDVSLVIGAARIYEMLGREEQALEFYKKVPVCLSVCSSTRLLVAHESGLVCVIGPEARQFECGVCCVPR